ncbi:MAG: extensin [Rhizorhabdus sp.]|nr:extensin [Rhizorhabdus sp.]
MTFVGGTFRIFAAVIVIALALVLYEWGRGHPQDLPWTPLSLADPVGRFTVLKLGRLRADLPACHRLLDAAGERYERLPAVSDPPGCGYADGIELRNDPDFRYLPAASVSCRVAAGLFLWEKQVVEPAAIRHFEQSVSQIETYGSYSCRPIRGAREGLSEHATANAIDIAAFRLADGRRIGVASHWRSLDDNGAFLHEVRDGACRIFATTLSPDYNAAHRDHLHIDLADRGGWAFCR